MHRAFLLTFLVVGSGGANAQFYKCTENGRTLYTEKPCSSGAISQTQTGGGGSSQPDPGTGHPHDLGKAACSAAIPNRVRLKDPYNAVLGAATGGESVVTEVADVKVMARSFTVTVNAKNLQGAYVGDRPVTCITSLDGRRVLSVDASRLDPGTLN